MTYWWIGSIVGLVVFVVVFLSEHDKGEDTHGAVIAGVIAFAGTLLFWPVVIGPAAFWAIGVLSLKVRSYIRNRMAAQDSGDGRNDPL